MMLFPGNFLHSWTITVFKISFSTLLPKLRQKLFHGLVHQFVSVALLFYESHSKESWELFYHICFSNTSSVTFLVHMAIFVLCPLSFALWHGKCFACSGRWHVFSGNELGSLLGWWLWVQRKENSQQPGKVVFFPCFQGIVSDQIDSQPTNQTNV